MASPCCASCRLNRPCEPDCIAKHFAREEVLARKHCPAEVVEWLLAEHRRLKAGGYQPSDVLAHADDELVVLAPYFPAAAVGVLEDEHRAYASRHSVPDVDGVLAERRGW